MNPEAVKNPPQTPPNHNSDNLSSAEYSIVPTGCQYCAVGCGYEAHIWKPGAGLSTPDNLIKLEQGLWNSPAMTERVTVDGIQKIASVMPDPKCRLNKGNHSPRGGTMGRDFVSIDAQGIPKQLDSVKERLTTPWLRTQNGWETLTNEEALDLVADLVRHATQAKRKDDLLHIEQPHRLGVKLFEYGSLENTYAATKLFFRLIGTPNVAFHDRPSIASNTQGFNDSGVKPHGYHYADIWSSDVLFLAGSNPFECQSVFFMQEMTGKRVIVLDPRRTITADYAEKTGGLHLQPKVLGSDVAVINALCRYIVEQRELDAAEWGRARFEDLQQSGMLRAQITPPTPSSSPKRDGPGKGRKARNQMDYETFKIWIKEQPSLKDAAEISGIDEEHLRQAARLLTGPMPEITLQDEDSLRRKDPARRKVSLIFEKGLIWGYSYHGTAAMANLGLLLGSVLRQTGQPVDGKPLDPLRADQLDPAPLGVTGRAGGHQKGWAIARYSVEEDNGDQFTADYPFYNSADYFEDGDWKFYTHHYLDPHLVGPTRAPRQPKSKTEMDGEFDINLLWIVGANPAGQMADAEDKWSEIADRRKKEPLPSSKSEALVSLKRRIAHDGLVIIQQDIYPNPTTHYADIVLPAKGWGEHNFTRYNGARMLRLYGRFQDSPEYEGEDRCLEDWRIFGEVAKRLFTRQEIELGLPVGTLAAGHGLPDGYAMMEPLGRDGFQWGGGAEDVFKDMGGNSNRKGSLGPVADLPSPLQWLRERGSNGIRLPAKATPAGPQPSDRDIPGTGSYAFVRCDWRDISHHFGCNKPRCEGERRHRRANDQFDPKTDEFYISNGRINELWNSLFTHIRNETVRQRYPDDMPGTFLEIHPQDASDLGVTTGDVVTITRSGGRSFKGVAITQEITPGQVTQVLPRGMVFAYFSYPVNKTGDLAGPFAGRVFEEGGEVLHTGYVNNITSDYVDPINPIAALKFARGKITKYDQRYAGLDLPRHEQRPSTQPRHIAFSDTQVADEDERLRWKMRELVVQIGLPKEAYNIPGIGKPHADIVVDPDQYVADFVEKQSARRAFKRGLPQMKFVRFWPAISPDILDEWTPAQEALAKAFIDLIESQST